MRALKAAVYGGPNKPGGTIRIIQPLNNRIALTLEGGFIGIGAMIALGLY